MAALNHNTAWHFAADEEGDPPADEDAYEMIKYDYQRGRRLQAMEDLSARIGFSKTLLYRLWDRAMRETLQEGDGCAG